MSAIQGPMLPVPMPPEEDWRDAVRRSSALLRKEGFLVSRPGGPRSPDDTSPDLTAADGSRVIRVFVLLDREIDAEETRDRLRAAYREGETRVYVPWPLSWRVLSNLTRWGLRGISVLGW